MEIAVRKATRLEYRPPKEKHLLTLKHLTFENPALVDSILLCLEKRLKEKSWIITYKVLTIVHYLMRQGNSVRVMDGVVKHPAVMDTSQIKNKNSSPANVHNIYLYRAYLDERVVAFRNLQRDYVQEMSNNKEGRLRHLSVSQGLLKETAALQRQSDAVLKCKFYLDDSDSSITFFAYRMTIEDLLALFQAVNEGVVNILEHYFEMNKKDATAALEVYKAFAQQTELTIDYLNEAKKLQSDLQMNIPSIKHAPLSLASALEEYLSDLDTAANKKSDQSKPLPQPVSNPATQQQSFQQPQIAQFQQQQPIQQQQFFQQEQQQQQQPLFNQFTGAQQPDQFSNNFYNSNTDAFSPNNTQSFAVQAQRSMSTLLQQQQQQPMHTGQNPFLAIMNQQQQSPTNNTSPYANMGHNQPELSSSPVDMSNNNQLLNNNNSNRAATMSMIGSSNTGSYSSNPFRSLSMSGPSPYSQQPQQIPVIKPVPYQSTAQQSQQPQQRQSTINPFSLSTPPLTPNQQLPLNTLIPQQQQQQHQSPYNTAPNPFMMQNQQQQQQNQQNLFNNPPSAF